MNKQLDLLNTEVYILNGTEHEDLNSPLSPFQGKTLAKYLKDPEGNWVRIMRGPDGSPILGYLAKEIDAVEAKLWKRRIDEARKSAGSGYQDAQGLWYPGAVPNSVITAEAHKKHMDSALDAFYSTSALTQIDAMADSITAPAESRSVEYAARLSDAKEYLANPGSDPEYAFLKGMMYKGLTMEEAAHLVIANAKAAKDKSATIADLRMKKNLLRTKISVVEKQAIYNQIIESLIALK